MVTLSWYRRGPNRWVLKAPDGQVWAVVTPYWDGFRNACRATVLGEQRNSYSIQKFGGVHWSLATGAAAAKRDAVRWLARRSWDSFQVAS